MLGVGHNSYGERAKREEEMSPRHEGRHIVMVTFIKMAMEEWEKA